MKCWVGKKRQNGAETRGSVMTEESWFQEGVSDESIKKAEKESSSGGVRRLWIPK